MNNRNTEFKPTHRWIQFPGIEFEVNYETNEIRGKGQNDSCTTKWKPIRVDRNNVKYFTMQRERIYWWDLEIITNN